MTFANTPASECLRKDVPNTQWAWVRAQRAVGGGAYEGWSGLGASLKTGSTAFDQVLGCGFWEYYRRNPEAGAIFNEAMRLKPGARLLLLEELIPETPEPVPGKWIDLLMMAITGGRERTEKEYRELLSAADFELEEVVPTAGPLSILIAKIRGPA